MTLAEVEVEVEVEAEAVTMEVEGVDSQARCLLLSPLRLIQTVR